MNTLTFGADPVHTRLALIGLTAGAGDGRDDFIGLLRDNLHQTFKRGRRCRNFARTFPRLPTV